MKRKALYLLAPVIGWIISHMSFAIPVKRLRETDVLLAFFATRPAYPFHVILMPKNDIRSFADLDPADPFMAELVSATQGLVEEFHLASWRLIVNGGTNQEFPHLHFHLISDNNHQRTQNGQADKSG
jgi:histidine triad (HIT) family protein